MHLQELEGVAGQAVLLQRLVEAVCEALQVAQHAAKAAKGQRALACAGISNLSHEISHHASHRVRSGSFLSLSF